MDTISTSQALQIAGRAGRYGTQFAEGSVTTYRKEDLPMLKTILSRPVDEIEAAGLHPTADQIELFAYHLPQATLSNLIDIFVSLCIVDDARYFMCNVDDFKFLADMIQHVPLPLRARYVFCCAPINRKMPFVCTMFLKFARQYSKSELVTLDWLCSNISWPFALPNTIVELVHLEAVFDVLDLYLWLSYRFPDLFPDGELVRDMQHELDEIIQVGVHNITRLLRNSESGITSLPSTATDDDSFTMKRKKETYSKGNRTVVPLKNSMNKSSGPELYENAENDENLEESEEYTPATSHGYLNMINASKQGEKFRGHGKLTESLLAQGLISKEQIEQLRKEWEEASNASNQQSPTNTLPKRK